MVNASLHRRILPLTALLALGGLAGLPARGTVPRAAPADNAPAERSIVELDDGDGSPGTRLKAAPDLEPLPSDPTLEDIRRHMAAGDTNRALHVAERFVAKHKWGRDRDAAAMAQGLLHREAGRHNLASEAFTLVRSGNGPLAPWGAYYEAEQDFARGRHWVSIRECERYATTWPKGEHVDACLALTARAHAALGRFQSARAAASQYDERHPDAGISEQIELALAEWEADQDPADAVDNLVRLALDHNAALTGRVAEETLSDLALAGVATALIPDDTPSLQRRALSLRRSARRAEAWSAFQELVRRSEDDPKLAAWCEAEAETFGWRTHNWDFLADWYGAKYATKADSELAWDRYRVLERGGRFKEAVAQAELGMKHHGGAKEWRNSQEGVSRTYLLAGEYAGARTLLDGVAAHGGWTGRRAAYYAAFASHMAGDHEDAVKRFDAVVARDKTYAVEARYWRSKSLAALERVDAANEDRGWIAENARNSWYHVLVRQDSLDAPGIAPFRRDGTWPGPDLPPPPKAVAHTAALGALPIAVPVSATARADATGFGNLSWPLAGLLAPVPASPDPVVLATDPIAPPPSYVKSTWFDPDRARGNFYRFAEANKDAWPSLPAIWDLARVGMYDLSGPLMSEVFEDWREARNRASHPRYLAARKLWVPTEDWRELFLFARDHHHSARFTYDLWDGVDDPQVAADAWRLAYPLAHDRLVWQESRDAGVDPYLVLGLMRQESTYNAIARSRVGASGAMQIMPRTGHLLANLAHDTTFTASDLEDPDVAVGYGISYLGLLLTRFEGVYPLAVASYNGGPFNVSAWLAGTGSEMPIDAWVEHIPFRETRDYVKKVSAGYATYLSLNAPEGTQIVMPATPRGDHPDVVDF